MKKGLPILVMLLVLAGVAVFTLRRKGGIALHFPASRAAELVPAETVAFLHLPDLDRTRARWGKSDFDAIAQEPVWDAPEGKRFLELWREGAQAEPALALLLRVWPELKTAAPAGFFLAATTVSNEPLPKLVGGFSFRGKKTDVESVVRVLKDHLLAKWPGAKAELASHDGIEIETITNPTPAQASLDILAKVEAAKKWPLPAVQIAYRDDWLFFATDRALLTGTLDRYARKRGLTPSLAENANFVECRKHELPEADVLAWQSWDVGGRNAVQHWGMLAGLWSEETLKSMHYSSRLDRPVRDRLYLQLPKAPLSAGLAKLPPALIPPDSLGYGAIDFDAFRAPRQRDWLETELIVSKSWRQLGLVLRDRKPSNEDPWMAFGPKVNFIFPGKIHSEWRDMVVAVDIRDAGKARKFIEEIVSRETKAFAYEIGASLAWRWHLPSDLPAPLVLTKTHLLFGTSGKAVERVAGSTIAAPVSAVPSLGGEALGEDRLVAHFYFDVPRILKDRSLTGYLVELEHFAIAPPPALREHYSVKSPLRYPRFVYDAAGRNLRPGTVQVKSAGTGWVVESDLGTLGNLHVFTLLRLRSGL